MDPEWPQQTHCVYLPSTKTWLCFCGKRCLDYSVFLQHWRRHLEGRHSLRLTTLQERFKCPRQNCYYIACSRQDHRFHQQHHVMIRNFLRNQRINPVITYPVFGYPTCAQLPESHMIPFINPYQ